ncbi:hypothetical protein PAXRUDRAFT_162664 [Paxillus rubicundulus Ve08.2h10]|uniref:Uncharacterized protein n=1 Tax=Paxillus rubicundulus Ve08.2h10 TaxID=930991 RepID=A0A0D0DL05_9AGAM|nr:hypothetical protein PAXRUDRAFT_162664 [Paxillus rubicundulus Ve08.2h10]
MPFRHSGDELPNIFSTLLVYVQPFNTLIERDATQLQILKRAPVPDSSHPSSQRRLGLVIPLTEVTHAVDLVPVFVQAVDGTVTAATSQEHYHCFYLNFYADKEIFDASFSFSDMNFEDAE